LNNKLEQLLTGAPEALFATTVSSEIPLKIVEHSKKH
jgi:hypothetical protein